MQLLPTRYDESHVQYDLIIEQAHMISIIRSSSAAGPDNIIIMSELNGTPSSAMSPAGPEFRSHWAGHVGDRMSRLRMTHADDQEPPWDHDSLPPAPDGRILPGSRDPPKIICCSMLYRVARALVVYATQTSPITGACYRSYYGQL